MSQADKAAQRAAAKAKVQDVLDIYKYIRFLTGYNGYDVELMMKLVLLDAGPEGSVKWELEITDFYANQNGVMHGGAAGVILDMCTALALAPIGKPGYWDYQGGVTRTLNISYLRAVPLNSKVHIHSDVIQHGRTMALIRGVMTSVDGKTIYATCEHHKVNVPARHGVDGLKAEIEAEIKRRGGDRSWLDDVKSVRTVLESGHSDGKAKL